MSKDYLFEKQMKGFLGQLNEQDPEPLPPVPTGGGAPAAPQQADRFANAKRVSGTTTTTSPGPPQLPAAEEPKSSDIRDPQRSTDIKYMSTPDMYTSVPPSDSADWPGEKKDYYWPLKSGKVGATLLKELSRTGFVGRGMGTAARYNEYQFRIIIRGDFYFDATIEATVSPDDEVDVNIAKISTQTPNSKSNVVFEGGDDKLGNLNMENIKIKMKTDGLRDWAGGKEVGQEEKVSKKEASDETEEPIQLKLPPPAAGTSSDAADDIADDFFGDIGEEISSRDKYLFEVEIERTAAEKKADYDRYLKPAFKRYVRNYLLTQSSPEAVKAALSDKKKKKEILDEFAKVYVEWAGITDENDERKRALEELVGKKIPIKMGPPPKKSKVEIEPVEDGDVGPTISSEKEAKKFFKSSIDGKEKEKLAIKVYNNIAAGLPEDHPFITKTKNLSKIVKAVEDNDTEEEALAKAFELLRKKEETVDLHSYLRNLLLEKTREEKGAFPKPPRSGKGLERERGGELISRMNDKLLKQWFGRRKIAASTAARFFEGNLYEFLAVSAATFRPRKRTIKSQENDGSVVIEFDGEIVTEAEVWIDARIGEKGSLSTWTFRVHDDPNKPFLTKGFGLIGKASAGISRMTPKEPEVTSKLDEV